MTCDEVRELLELYALGVLDRDEQAEVAAHLASDCKRCKADLPAAVQLNSALLMTVEEAALPPSLRKRVLASVRPESSWAGPVANWIWAGVAAAAVAIAVWHSHEQDQTIAALQRNAGDNAREVQRLNTAFAFLRDPQTRPATAAPNASQPRGTYFISPRGVLLIASNLPALASGQTYEMWVIPKGQAPRPAGLFRPDPTGSAVHFVDQPVDVQSAQALAVSVEPEAGSAAPTSTPMLVTPVVGL